MYVATHLPQVPNAISTQNDKVIHFGAYFVLAFLMVAWRESRRATYSKTAVQILVLIAGYGAFDEITQPCFGRDAEVLDWVADIFGAAAGVTVSWWVTTRFLRFKTTDATGNSDRV